MQNENFGNSPNSDSFWPKRVCKKMKRVEAHQGFLPGELEFRLACFPSRFFPLSLLFFFFKFLFFYFFLPFSSRLANKSSGQLPAEDVRRGCLRLEFQRTAWSEPGQWWLGGAGLAALRAEFMFLKWGADNRALHELTNLWEPQSLSPSKGLMNPNF